MRVVKEHSYRCPHCQSFVLRRSTKAWITSWCCKFNRTVRLQRAKRRRHVSM